jgi:hypothetical protein
MTADEQPHGQEPGQDWAVSLRRQPASIPDGRPDAFKLIAATAAMTPP